jgi:uncharacterized damage-inducible protein DinB
MKSHFAMMADYNAWANERLYRMASGLPDEPYRRDVGAFFKSLHGTLNHILCADLIWMRRLTGVGEQPTSLSAILCDELSALWAARQQQDRRIVDYVASLSDAQIEESWAYQTLNGTPRQQLRREILAHLFNHQTHHRGQAHAILTVLGVSEPEGLDLLIMQWEL